MFARNAPARTRVQKPDPEVPPVKWTIPVLVACSLTSIAQEYPASQLKHLSVPTTTNPKPLAVAALEIERGFPYPSVIHLKGAVEIRTPVCVPTGVGSALSCAGYLVVRADAADLREETGEIETHGHVTITREK